MKFEILCLLSGCIKPLDLAIGLDVSSRSNAIDFKLMKEAAATMVSNFKVGASNSHVALMTFSSSARSVFNFGRTYDLEKMKTEISSLAQDASAESNVARALDVARSDLFSLKGRSRRGIAKALLLITQGPFSAAKAAIVQKSADKLKLATGGVEIIPVFIGNKNGADAKLMESVATTSVATSTKKFFQFDATSDFIKNANLLKISSAACSGNLSISC